MFENYLYFEPVVYVPYSINLRKHNSIKLVNMWIEDGQIIDVSAHFNKFVRLPNQNHLQVIFNSPLHMNVTELVGTQGVITFNMKYEINFDDEETIKVFHKQSINFLNSKERHKSINNYSSSFALPAMFGSEGLALAKEQETHDTGRTILQIGILEEDKSNRTWCIETLDRLYPNTDLKHGVVH